MGKGTNRAESLARLTLPALAAERHQAAAALAQAKASLEEVDHAVAGRLTAAAAAAFAAAGKADGTVTFAAAPGWKARATISRTVRWDQARLGAVAAGLDPDDARDLFKVTLEVTEPVFRTIAAGPLRDAVAAARSVRLGDLRVLVEPDV